MEKKTLVLGASANPARYSHLAVRSLQHRRHPVVAIGRQEGLLEGIQIQTGTPPLEGVHTVSLYLNAGRQREYYAYLLGLRPKRIIFNPGAENPELAELAGKAGIETLNACTLVMLSTGQY